MSGSPSWVHAVDDGVELYLYISPKSSKNAFVGAHGDRLKVSVAAPPVDGKANKALVRFIAKALGVPRGAVSIVKGESAKQKVVRVVGIGAGAVVEALG